MKKSIILTSFLISSAATSVAIASENIQLITQPMTTLCVNNDISSIPSGCDERFDTIQEALSYLDNYMIASDATVKIEMTEAPTSSYYTIYVNHPDGDKINIEGSCGSSKCEINFKSGQNGLVVENGNKLGSLKNFAFIGKIVGDKINGISVVNNSTIQMSEMEIYSFPQHGINVNNNSYASIASTTIHGNGKSGVVVSRNSNIVADNVQTTANSELGFIAQYNSLLNLNGKSSAIGNGLKGTKLIVFATAVCDDGNDSEVNLAGVWQDSSVYWGDNCQNYTEEE
ncbi:MAG: right-handed parallel beta-helix repeat-containing protein [Pseudomonadota bacterium]